MGLEQWLLPFLHNELDYKANSIWLSDNGSVCGDYVLEGKQPHLSLLMNTRIVSMPSI